MKLMDELNKLEEKFNNDCGFDEDDSLDMAVKSGFLRLLEMAKEAESYMERERKVLEQLFHLITAYAFFGKEGIERIEILNVNDDLKEAIKEDLDFFKKIKKIIFEPHETGINMKLEVDDDKRKE